MAETLDYRKFQILYVDDEEIVESLRARVR